MSKVAEKKDGLLTIKEMAEISNLSASYFYTNRSLKTLDLPIHWHRFILAVSHRIRWVSILPLLTVTEFERQLAQKLAQQRGVRGDAAILSQPLA